MTDIIGRSRIQIKIFVVFSDNAGIVPTSHYQRTDRCACPPKKTIYFDVLGFVNLFSHIYEKKRDETSLIPLECENFSSIPWQSEVRYKMGMCHQDVQSRNLLVGHRRSLLHQHSRQLRGEHHLDEHG